MLLGKTSTSFASMRKVHTYILATTIPSQGSTAMVFPALRSGTVSSDVFLWVLFLLNTALLLAVVVHERGGIFFQVRGYNSRGPPEKWD